MTTAVAAPALTPSRPGSANGLRVSACMTAPAIPRARPTAIPSTVRGIRNSCTIVEVEQHREHFTGRDVPAADRDREQRHHAQQRYGEEQSDDLATAGGGYPLRDVRVTAAAAGRRALCRRLGWRTHERAPRSGQATLCKCSLA